MGHRKPQRKPVRRERAVVRPPSRNGEPGLWHAETAELLGYSVSYLYILCHEESIPYHKWRGRNVYYVSEIRDRIPETDLGDAARNDALREATQEAAAA